MNSDEMNFCKDCKHYELLLVASCKHKNNWRDIVTGEQCIYGARSCRENEDKCGRSGKWFEKISDEELEMKEKKRIEELERNLQFMTSMHENMYSKAPQKESRLTSLLKMWRSQE